MDESAFWIVAIIIALGVIVALVFIIEWNTSPSSGQPSSGSTGNSGVTTTQLGQRHEICSVTPCGPGLICTSISGQTEPRCLSDLDQVCSVDSDCASGTCYRNTVGQTGICRDLTSSAPTTRIFSRRGDDWIVRLNIPSGLLFNRVSSSGNQLLGISTSTNSVYLYNGSSWASISTTFTSPGNLIDGVITPGYIWLVYVMTSGQTAVYQLINNSLLPYTSSTGGIQSDISGNPITITSIDASADGTIFLVGTTSSSQSMIYRKKVTETKYTPITLGTEVAVRPGGTGDEFAFASGSSILLLGTSSSRQDGITGTLVDFTITPDNNIWYITNTQETYQLYRNGSIITTPVTLTSRSRLFYSSVDSLCLYTPGY